MYVIISCVSVTDLVLSQKLLHHLHFQSVGYLLNDLSKIEFIFIQNVFYDRFSSDCTNLWYTAPNGSKVQYRVVFVDG
jgi:hypothetical protein